VCQCSHGRDPHRAPRRPCGSKYRNHENDGQPPKHAAGVWQEPGRHLPQGTLDLLILKALSLEPQHGWAVSQRIHQISRKALTIPQGSLYPALHRLERKGWIRSKWGVTEGNRRARFYELTARGRGQLKSEQSDWDELVAAIGLVLRTE
jgi:transcriptional regulator